MKKPYSRPQLAFESYQLDAAIATICAVKLWYGMNTCSVDLVGDQGNGGPGGGREFFNYVNCQTDLVGTGDNNESVCYHGPYSSFDILSVFLHS